MGLRMDLSRPRGHSQLPVLNWEKQDKPLLTLLPDGAAGGSGTSLSCRRLTFPRAPSEGQEKRRNPWLQRQEIPAASPPSLELQRWNC